MASHVSISGAVSEVPAVPTKTIEVGNIAHYSKVIAYIVASGLGALALSISSHESLYVLGVHLGLALAGAVGVYFVTKDGYIKAVLAVTVAVLQGVLPFAIAGHLTAADLIQVALAGFAAAGVAVVPNGAATKIQATAIPDESLVPPAAPLSGAPADPSINTPVPAVDPSAGPDVPLA